MSKNVREETMNLIAITTYFQKSSYTTWTHPRSKLPHQIDHLISEKPNFCRFTDAFLTKPLVDSDHLAVKCKLRIKFSCRKASICNPLSKLDTDPLIDDVNLRNEFNSTVQNLIENNETTDKFNQCFD